jgi:hypothetical protein
MRIVAVMLALSVLGCGKSAKEQLKDDIEKEQARGGLPDPTMDSPKVVKQAPDPVVKKEKPPPDPEPTTPEEIDTARKKAMIDGRDVDVIRFCGMAKLDVAKADAQIMLGCTLAACRVHAEDKAKEWAKGVAKSKPLFEQAVKTCMANKVVL